MNKKADALAEQLGTMLGRGLLRSAANTVVLTALIRAVPQHHAAIAEAIEQLLGESEHVNTADDSAAIAELARSVLLAARGPQPDPAP